MEHPVNKVIEAVRQTAIEGVRAYETIIRMAEELTKHDERMSALEVGQQSLEVGQQSLAAVLEDVKKNVQYASDYCTFGPYAKHKGFIMDEAETALHGKAMTRWCKALGIPIRKWKHERYREVGSYPEAEMDKYITTQEFTMIRENYRKR